MVTSSLVTVTALNHFEVRSLSRSSGRSAVAAAAYRSGERLHDDRNGGWHDYRARVKRHEIIEGFILTPPGAEWAQDRPTLWNGAEWSEKRVNSVVAREYIVALPHELDAPQRRELIEAFAEHLVERYRIAVDVNLHAPDVEGDQRNHHAHVLTTTRRIDASGFGEKTRELDAKETRSEETRGLREKLADLTNEALERARCERRVDARSHKDRGLEEAPQRKDGPVVTEYRRRAEKAHAEGREVEIEVETARPSQGRGAARQRRSAEEVRAEVVARLEAKVRELERQIAAEWARLRDLAERAAAALERKVAEARERLGAVVERFSVQERRRAHGRAAEQDASARDMRDVLRIEAVEKGWSAGKLQGALRKVEELRTRGELNPLSEEHARIVAAYRQRLGVGATGELVVGADGRFVLSREVAEEQGRRVQAWRDRYETQWRVERRSPAELDQLRVPVEAKLQAARADGLVRALSPDTVRQVEAWKVELAGREHRELADRFLRTSPAERMADPAFRTAQQQYVRIVAGWIGSKEPDERAVDVRGLERELAHVLAQGRTFNPADVSPADAARVRGERFRVLTPEQRAADPELRNAQGYLSAFSLAVAARLPDRGMRAKVLDRAEAEIVARLSAGETFKAVLVQDVERAPPKPSPGREPTVVVRKPEPPDRER